MLPPEELARLIALEGQRMGMGQSWFDQNFGPTSQFAAAAYGPSQWVPGPTGAPVVSPDWIAQIVPAMGSTAPDDTLVCPVGTVKEFVGDRWQCTAIAGYVVDPEKAIYEPVTYAPGGAKPSAASALPAFVGGNLGRVQYTTIPNRNHTGIRFGTLPRVIMDDVPGSFGSMPGIATYSGPPGSGGGSENIEP